MIPGIDESDDESQFDRKPATRFVPTEATLPILLRCVGGPKGCNEAIRVDLKRLVEGGVAAVLFHDYSGWLLSVVSTTPQPKEAGDFSAAPLCPKCAPKVQRPDVLKAARARLATEKPKAAPAPTGEGCSLCGAVNVPLLELSPPMCVDRHACGGRQGRSR